jgi:DNA-binding GntR family transcriptional regulator
MVVTAPTPRDIDEIYGIRLLVEAEALRRISPSDTEIIQKLENCIRRGADGIKSVGSRALTDPENDFHLVLVSILNNRRLQDFLNSVYGLATTFRFLSMEEEAEAQAAMHDHMQIVDLLKQGRSEDAIGCLTDHIKISRENLKQRLSAR